MQPRRSTLIALTCVGLFAACAAVAHAQTYTVTSSVTYNGQVYTQSPAGILLVDGTSAPLFTLTNAASTSGITDLYVGSLSGNTGAIAVMGGSAFSNSGNVFLGFTSNTTGSATISGVNTTWSTAGSFYLGGSATASAGSAIVNVVNSGSLNVAGTLKLWNKGSLTLDTGGSITATNFDNTAGTFTFNGGTLTINGGTLTQSGTLTVSGVSSPSLILSSSAAAKGVTSLYVGTGSGQSGSLSVVGGSALTASSDVYLSNLAGSTGIATVSGSGSVLTFGGTLWVGSDGGSGATGSLIITNGGQVVGPTASVGSYTNSVGIVLVSGAGSTWTITNSNGLLLGGGNPSEGTTTATLTVSGGGSVISARSQIGAYDNSTGFATITTGGTFITTGTLYIGGNFHPSTGNLNILAGGIVTSGTAVVGGTTGSMGTAVVNGAGATWTNTGTMYVGSDDFGSAGGAGFLTVTAGGTISNASGTIQVLAPGIVTIGAGSSIAAKSVNASAGTFNVGGTLNITGTGTSTITALTGSGTINLSQSGTILSIRGGSYSGTINGPESVNYSGVVTLSGANAYTGASTVSAGAVVTVMNTTGSALGSGTATVSGALAGTGTIGGSVYIAASGTIAPGSGLTPGVLTVGNLNTLGAGTLSFVLGATSASDMISVVNTNLGFAAGTHISITSLSGFTTGTYELIQYNSGVGVSGINNLTIGSAPGSLGYQFVNDTTNHVIDVVISPLMSWNGSGSPQAGTPGVWDVNNSNNWIASGQSQTYFNGVDVTFDNSAATSTVTIVGAVNPGSLLFLNTTASYTIYGGMIAGNAAVTLSGTQPVVFANQNTYTGSTLISAGATLQLGTATQAGTLVGSTIITNSGILNLVNGLVSAPTLDSSTGTVSMNGVALTLSGSGTSTISTLSGSGAIASGGTLALLGSSTFNGTISTSVF